MKTDTSKKKKYIYIIYNIYNMKEENHDIVYML